ncbi:hypothetical protein PU629_06530 [Pullulanibacillus sp. KACC 23026]|uniref:hypothetical protein n=1 Tax=Pullulanibacillus sp. KACC 23026 TaxID=3028315 RepID=UPI0023B06185|nr:hypothetical protein [Pullulanibacillus sp. KACC 23026]WEG14020.1 hypothetical protein PU629_06530 [Pullulanibacillus sp. KACC 23026]
MELTQKDIDLAKRYIIVRSAIKGLTKDKEKLAGLELEEFYVHLLERALAKANDELREINKRNMRISKTDEPTVYEARIGNRKGYFEINIVEISLEIQKLLMANFSKNY